MAYYVHILKNPDDRFYIGQTSDLNKRLEQHNSGAAISVNEAYATMPDRLPHNTIPTQPANIAISDYTKDIKNSVNHVPPT